MLNGGGCGVYHNAIQLRYNHIGCRRAVQLGHDAVADNLEVSHILLCNRLGRLLRNLQRVNIYAILPDAVVEVRARRCSRATHITDKLALRYARALLDTLGVATQVQVSRYEVACVLDFEGVTTATSPAFERNDAISYGVYGCALGCGIIHSEVGTIYSMHGVQTRTRETRADARELKRRLEQLLTQ